MRKFIVLTALMIFSISLFPFAASAASFLGGGFGGKIIDIRFCTTPPGILIDISGPSYGEYIYTAGTSTLYEYYSIFSPGTWLLGTSIGPNVPCMFGLIPIGYGQIIQKVGTSRPGF